MREDIQIINKIKEAVLAVDNTSKLVLYGSRARGDYKEDSDWDFLVLTSKKIQPAFKREMIDKITEVEVAENICIQLLLRNMIDWEEWNGIIPVYKNIKKDGIWI